MADHSWLAQVWAEHQQRLRKIAYRILGSASEAEDAVQEAWLRMSRADATEIENLGGWLTTIVARVSLNMLRARETRREEPFAETEFSRSGLVNELNPEHQVELADSVGLALLVVLDTLRPAERLAFVLHDMFDLSFDEIGRVIGCSAATARQHASRARRRLHGRSKLAPGTLACHRAIVDAFLSAVRAGDFEALLAVLDPDVVIRVDRAALPGTAVREFKGAELVAKRALAYGANVEFARTALINGDVGVVVAPAGRLRLAMRFRFTATSIKTINLNANKARLLRLDLGVLP